MAASGGVTRRMAQTAVIFLVLLVSTAAATLGLALLANSRTPFQHAFAAQHGAHVVAAVDRARASDAQLAATGRLPQVAETAGPFPETSITLAIEPPPPPAAPAGLPAGSALPSPPPLSLASARVVGRASPGGPLDNLTLDAGRWAQRPGEIVLSRDLGLPPGTQLLGAKVTVTSAPGKPRLTVVGFAKSITDSADGWVAPAQIAALRAPSAPALAQMLYRFRNAGSAAQVRADIAAVTAALPAGAVIGTGSWLTAQDQATGTSSVIAPFVVAFALIGLAMAVLIVANVVSGAVVAGYRRIGVLKSIGFTPAQVVGAYVARVLVPALAGCLIGVVAGNVLAVPVLQKSASVYGVGRQQVPVWVDIATPLLMCALAGLVALFPALRAGRLSAVAAIATGQAPPEGRGYAAHRLLGRLRLPRPVTIGLAAPFARPARTAVTLAAIVFGATAVIFAVGLDSSLAKAAEGQTHAHSEQVQVSLANGSSLQAGSSQDSRLVAALRAQPGTLHYVAEAMPVVSASGLTQRVNAEAFRSDASWTGYDMVSGHWYRGPGEVDVNTAFLTQAGVSVGDTITVTVGGHTVSARIVGEVFDPQGSDQPALIASWQTLGGTAAGLTIAQYDVGLRPGVSADSYANALNQALGPAFTANVPPGRQFYQIAISLIGILTLLMAVVAALGVLNTVLLGTRDRVHDLGVFKAVGMTPRQVIAMVVCWVVGPAVVAAVIAVPAGEALHSVTAQAMGRAAHTGIPGSFVHVYQPAELVLLALSGLAIAVLGALLPASWAAQSRTAAALRAE
jgi:putative ABC transport system permease protein